MNLRDLAKLAGVSPSTISKVINGKDNSISPSTRERILALVKEYNYKIHSSALPYSNKSLMLGVIVNNLEDNMSLLNGISQEAQRSGYSVITRFSAFDPLLEEKNIAVLSAYHVDALIWEPVNEESLGHLSEIEENGIDVFLYNAPTADSFHLDYEPFSFEGTKALIKLGHTAVACVASKTHYRESFISGYRNALFQNNILIDPSLIFTEVSEVLLQKIASHAVTAVISSQYSTSVELFHAATSRNISIPANLSILTLSEESGNNESLTYISNIEIPFITYGKYLCHSLIEKIEKKREEPSSFPTKIEISGDSTISISFQALPKRVLVVGSINIDNYLRVNALPRSGKTVISSSAAFYAGGKALNEAVGLAKLGIQTAVIGSVGSDSDSDVIFNTLRQFHIDQIGIKRAIGEKTGQAYIFVQGDGESMISIMSGANALVSRCDIDKMKSQFENTAFCLIQTEIPMDAVIEASNIARANHITTILKPTACGPLPMELLKNVDILVPNREELNAICSKGNSIDEKADYLIGQGVGIVVVTLDSEGCYIRKGGETRYFSAAPFPAVDVSGAADAFISALTAYLYHDEDIFRAAEIANYAAGYSVSKEGVIPSLISRQELERWVQSN